MFFYISWYPGDPYYPVYDNDCSLLISITSVSREWSMKSFPVLPKRLMIDSGGFRFASSTAESLSPRRVFERQLSLLSDLEIPTVICSLDVPIIDTSLLEGEKDLNIHRTIANAYELKNIIAQKNLLRHIEPMAIIQGHSADAVYLCANELKAIGFSKFGIGSLALLNNPTEVIERVKSVVSVIAPNDIHVFGVNALNLINAFRKLGIGSVDSAKPAKAAAFNEIIYSNPFRRYGILESSSSTMRGRIPSNRRLSEPLPCNCPVCKDGVDRIMGVGKRENIRNRTLHNYFHLKKAFFSNET